MWRCSLTWDNARLTDLELRMSVRKSIGIALCLVFSITTTAWVLAQGQGRGGREGGGGGAGGGGGRGGVRQPVKKNLLYVTTPGSTYAMDDITAFGGTGIVVFDVNNKHRFVKRI